MIAKVICKWYQTKRFLDRYSKNVESNNQVVIMDSKGVYISLYNDNGPEFLRSEIGEEELVMEKKFEEGVDYINRWWKKKAIKRYTKLHSEGRLKPEHLFYIDAIGMSWEQMKSKYLKEWKIMNNTENTLWVEKS